MIGQIIFIAILIFIAYVVSWASIEYQKQEKRERQMHKEYLKLKKEGYYADLNLNSKK